MKLGKKHMELATNYFWSAVTFTLSAACLTYYFADFKAPWVERKETKN